jgi:hypothetical protein
MHLALFFQQDMDCLVERGSMLSPESKTEMNAEEKAEAYQKAIQNSKDVKSIPLQGPIEILPTEFTASELPPAPFQRLQKLFESQTEENVIEAFQDPKSTFSRYLQVSREFARGAISLFNLPPRDQYLRYNKALIVALRHLFAAFAGIDI